MHFNKIPTRMGVALVHLSVFWLNTFLATDGISETMSPRTIIVGSKVDFNKHCKIDWGIRTNPWGAWQLNDKTWMTTPTSTTSTSNRVRLYKMFPEILRFSDKQGEMSRLGQLQKVGKADQVLATSKGARADKIYSTQRCEKPHWWDDDQGKGISVFSLHSTKTKYNDHNQSQACWGWKMWCLWLSGQDVSSRPSGPKSMTQKSTRTTRVLSCLRRMGKHQIAKEQGTSMHAISL